MSRGALAAPALAGLGGVLAGLFLGGLGSAERPDAVPAAPRPAAGADSPELVAVLREVSRSVDELLGLLRQRSSSPAPDEPAAQRMPVAPDPVLRLDEETSEVLQRIAESLRDVRVLPPSSRALPEVPRNDSALLEVAGRKGDELMHAYDLLTYREVIERMGRPDEVSGGGDSLTFQYHLRNSAVVAFTFVDGLVVHASTWKSR